LVISCFDDESLKEINNGTVKIELLATVTLYMQLNAGIFDIIMQ